MELNNVTIVAVAGVRPEEALWAIDYSCRDIKFGASKLITPHTIQSETVDIIACNALNYEQYNHFIVYELWKYIDTDFALLVQDDGYVVNPFQWNDEFLEYDYIGAVWPMPQDDFSFRDHTGELYRVGNGGFSLRSKKLLKLATDLNLEWKPYYGFYNEDGFYCVHHRKTYEQHGCKYAPIDIAASFSQEVELPEQMFTIPFGFHGKNHYYYKQTKI